MQPFRFHELLKTTLWGGHDILEIKGQSQRADAIGESWEISGMLGHETPVDGGISDGWVLSELISHYGADFLGKENLHRYGTHFPLLIKFISAARPLSIQVHPGDEMAHRLGHPFGKTELWYIVKADAGSYVYSGFRDAFSAQEYTRALEDGTLTEHIATHLTHTGDGFFIPPGRIHSIGAGNFLIEIQRSSDDTFRVYDFNRLDANGKKRELHVDLAREALDYRVATDYRIPYVSCPNCPVVLADCEFFTTRLLQLQKDICMDYQKIDSFVIYVAFEGTALLTDSENNAIELSAGQSVLFPACNSQVSIHPLDGDLFSCLETFIK